MLFVIRNLNRRVFGPACFFMLKDNLRNINQHFAVVQVMLRAVGKEQGTDMVFAVFGAEGVLLFKLCEVIDDINNSKALKVSIDIPTGLDPDTGNKFDKAVNADLIITFHDLKTGLKNYEDKTVVVDIGLPK